MTDPSVTGKRWMGRQFICETSEKLLRVSHQRLIWKLELKRGVHGNTAVDETLCKCKKDEESTKRKILALEVINGVPQGSLLAPVKFLVHIYDDIGTESYTTMFADDAKIQTKIVD